jgi:hypothetical protein
LDVHTAEETPGVLPGDGAHLTVKACIESRLNKLRSIARGVFQGTQDMTRRSR